jgi:GxxExxY protein
MVPVIYQDVPISEGFRADIIVDRQIILENKAVTTILPAHEAQVQTYLRMSGSRIGLILNFDGPRLKDGLRRFVV